MSSNINSALKNIGPKVAAKRGIAQRVAQMLDQPEYETQEIASSQCF